MNDDQKITYFGKTNYRNQERQFGIKKIDRRKHVYVIGKTGMGKTTLLENMAMQDIQSGEGLAFIDPHGETAYKLLDFVPKERINDVIYFDPADTNFPVGFNIMENVDSGRRHFVASGLMGVFKKIFGPDVWSARMEYILGNTVLALLEYPDSTLLSINPMLAVKEFRKKVVDNVKDPVVKAFWTQEFAKYTERFAAEATPAIQNKVGQFTSNALIRNIVGQHKSSFDMRDVMDNRKILIVNLAKGRVGEDAAYLLGAMVVTKLYLAAMSRVDIKEEKNRKDFFLYVDEFQSFATESFKDILSEARKYRLSLTLAHQYMAQLAEEVRDAVIGNVGTMLSFRVGAEDAEFLEKEFSPELTANDIVNLGFAQVYLKLMIDGAASRPFSAATLPPIVIPHQSFREEITQTSRKNYGTPRENVDKMIRDWATSLEGESAGKISGVMERPDRPSAKSNVPLYDAICVVCGKKTQVPFEPDPNRPVFCKDHLGLAGKYTARIASSGAGPARLAPSAPSPTRSVESSPSAPKPIAPRVGQLVTKEIRGAASLKQLVNLSSPGGSPFKKRPASPDASRGRIDERERTQKQDNLAALREALKKSLATQKKTEPLAPTPESASQSAPEPKPQSGVLRPGEKIEL